MIRHKIFFEMTPGATKNEKIERQGYKKMSQRAPKVSQKAAKGSKIVFVSIDGHLDPRRMVSGSEFGKTLKK